MFADTHLETVLIKASFAEQLGPPWEQPCPEESAKDCGSHFATIGHATKTGSQSSSTQYIETNTKRLPIEKTN